MIVSRDDDELNRQASVLVGLYLVRRGLTGSRNERIT